MDSSHWPPANLYHLFLMYRSDRERRGGGVRGRLFRVLCTETDAQNQAIRADVSSSSGFDWGDFGLGAGAMLGFARLFGGAVAAVPVGRRSGVRPRSAS